MDEKREIEVFQPTSNLDTIRDGRGGIFTWVPQEPIVEWNMNIIKEGKKRGNHYHPEFIEYFLVVDGNCVVISKNQDGKEVFHHLAKGQCIRTPKNTPHVVHAITDTTAIALLTKKWDDSTPPIVYTDMDKKE